MDPSEEGHWIYSHGPRPVLVSMIGLPGAGKTTFSRALAEELGFVLVNRAGPDTRRLPPLSPMDLRNPDHSVDPSAGYAEAEHCADLALPAVLDWSHHTPELQRAAAGIARRHDAMHVYAWLHADADTAEARLVSRGGYGNLSYRLNQYVVEEFRRRIEAAAVTTVRPGGAVVSVDARRPTAVQVADFLRLAVRLEEPKN